MIKQPNLNEVFLREVKKRISVQVSSRYRWWNFFFAVIMISLFFTNPTFLGGLFALLGAWLFLFDTNHYITIVRDIGIKKLFEADFNGEKIKVVASDKLEVVIILADQDKQISMDDVTELDYVIV